MKKYVVCVKAIDVNTNYGFKPVWREIKKFNDFAVADEWLCDYVRSNGYFIGDFTIKSK